MSPEPNPKDNYAQARLQHLTYAERLFRDLRLENNEIIGDLIARGASLKNYAYPKGEASQWNPQVVDAPNRKMVRFTKAVQGAQWGAETLVFGLKHSVKTDGSYSQETTGLFMFPYLRFNNEGTVESIRSYILIFSAQQVADLKRLLNFTPTGE